MTRALINIDYTVDFVADEGTLTSGKPGQQIEETITKLTNMFLKRTISSFSPLMLIIKMIGTTLKPNYFLHTILLGVRDVSYSVL